MTLNNTYIDERGAYEADVFTDLTVNDALILIAVCATKEKTETETDPDKDAAHIAALAKRQALFSDLGDSIEPIINKFMNMIGTINDPDVAFLAAVKQLKPEQKNIAFSWITEILMPDGMLSDDRNEILSRYAGMLDIDRKDAKQIVAEKHRWGCS